MPHMQIRSKPTASPSDLELFLRPLRDAGINIIAAGGSNVELDGEVAVAVDHEDIERAVEVLEGAGYKPYTAEVYECWMEDVPGELHRCIREASAENLSAGRVIKDFAIGTPRKDDGRILIQIYSVEVRSQANTVTPEPGGGGAGGGG